MNDIIIVNQPLQNPQKFPAFYWIFLMQPCKGIVSSFVH